MSTNTATRTVRPTHNGVVEVSELPADRVVDYAREIGDVVHLERKGGRTYLVTAE